MENPESLQSCMTSMDLVKEIRQIYDNYGFKSQILAASIGSPEHVKEAALIYFSLFIILFFHYLYFIFKLFFSVYY